MMKQLYTALIFIFFTVLAIPTPRAQATTSTDTDTQIDPSPFVELTEEMKIEAEPARKSWTLYHEFTINTSLDFSKVTPSTFLMLTFALPNDWSTSVSTGFDYDWERRGAVQWSSLGLSATKRGWIHTGDIPNSYTISLSLPTGSRDSFDDDKTYTGNFVGLSNSFSFTLISGPIAGFALSITPNISFSASRGTKLSNSVFLTTYLTFAGFTFAYSLNNAQEITSDGHYYARIGFDASLTYAFTPTLYLNANIGHMPLRYSKLGNFRWKNTYASLSFSVTI